jgi:hypothetical protein
MTARLDALNAAIREGMAEDPAYCTILKGTRGAAYYLADEDGDLTVALIPGVLDALLDVSHDDAVLLVRQIWLSQRNAADAAFRRGTSAGREAAGKAVQELLGVDKLVEQLERLASFQRQAE